MCPGIAGRAYAGCTTWSRCSLLIKFSALLGLWHGSALAAAPKPGSKNPTDEGATTGPLLLSCVIELSPQLSRDPGCKGGRWGLPAHWPRLELPGLLAAPHWSCRCTRQLPGLKAQRARPSPGKQPALTGAVRAPLKGITVTLTKNPTHEHHQPRRSARMPANNLHRPLLELAHDDQPAGPHVGGDPNPAAVPAADAAASLRRAGSAGLVDGLAMGKACNQAHAPGGAFHHWAAGNLLDNTVRGRCLQSHALYRCQWRHI